MDRYFEVRNRLFSSFLVRHNMSDEELLQHLHDVHNVPSHINGGNHDDLTRAHNLDHNLGDYSHEHES